MKLRCVVERARLDNNRGKPDLALEHLRSIRQEIDGFSGTGVWAEFSLVKAEALAAKRDPAAESSFGEAIQRVGTLSEGQPLLEMRAHESYAKFLVESCRGKAPKARHSLVAAKEIAVKHNLGEDTARIQLRIVHIDLANEGTQSISFMTMKRVAHEGEYTSQEQLAAWHQHLGRLEESSQGMRFGRKSDAAGETYFRHLLESARVALNEEATK